MKDYLQYPCIYLGEFLRATSIWPLTFISIDKGKGKTLLFTITYTSRKQLINIPEHNYHFIYHTN